MADQISVDELAKAASNLGRIEEFLALRVSWHLELDGHEALAAIDRAAESLARRVDAFLEELGVAEAAPAVVREPLPTSRFDSQRLAKLAAFMQQLALWFDSHAGCKVASGGGEHLGVIRGIVRAIRQAAESTLEDSPFRESVPEQRPPAAESAAPSPAEAERGASAAPARRAQASAGYDPSSGRLFSAGRVAHADRLVLEDTDHDPLLESFKNETLLTHNAKTKVSDFLSGHGVDLAGYRLSKFLDEVVRRIQRTPDGQVLVLKIGGFEDHPKPFFSYVPKVTRDKLAAATGADVIGRSGSVYRGNATSPAAEPAAPAPVEDEPEAPDDSLADDLEDMFTDSSAPPASSR